VPAYLHATEGGVEILLHVQPRASRTRVAGEHGGRLKLQVAAPPVDGEANQEVLSFLRERLGLPRRQIELVHGHTGRRKTVLVAGLSPEEIRRRLDDRGRG
jgi:uncharacterized protein